ncbi:unnamed protein product [Cochlearia groenlandica]
MKKDKNFEYFSLKKIEKRKAPFSMSLKTRKWHEESSHFSRSHSLSSSFSLRQYRSYRLLERESRDYSTASPRP